MSENGKSKTPKIPPLKIGNAEIHFIDEDGLPGAIGEAVAEAVGAMRDSARRAEKVREYAKVYLRAELGEEAVRQEKDTGGSAGEGAAKMGGNIQMVFLSLLDFATEPGIIELFGQHVRRVMRQRGLSPMLGELCKPEMLAAIGTWLELDPEHEKILAERHAKAEAASEHA